MDLVLGYLQIGFPRFRFLHHFPECNVVVVIGRRTAGVVTGLSFCFMGSHHFRDFVHMRFLPTHRLKSELGFPSLFSLLFLRRFLCGIVLAHFFGPRLCPVLSLRFLPLFLIMGFASCVTITFSGNQFLGLALFVSSLSSNIPVLLVVSRLGSVVVPSFYRQCFARMHCSFFIWSESNALASSEVTIRRAFLPPRAAVPVVLTTHGLCKHAAAVSCQ